MIALVMNKLILRIRLNDHQACLLMNLEMNILLGSVKSIQTIYRCGLVTIYHLKSIYSPLELALVNCVSLLHKPNLSYQIVSGRIDIHHQKSL